MEKIQMVDLVSQYQRLKPEIDAAMQAVVNHAGFIQGPEVKLFAEELQEYLGIQYVVPCANGTDALQLALMALDLPENAEVLVPCFNYVATAEVIALLKLKPVFVEVESAYFGMDVQKLEQYLTPNTKVIMPVHLYGQCADMDAIMDFAKKHQLFVIEDCAQAIGAYYTSSDGNTYVAGSMGHISTTSFFPSKNLGCFGDGGAMFTNSAEYAQKLKCLANHGQAQKYHYDMIGVNSRLDTLQAALLRVKLRHLNSFTEARNAAATVYDELLFGLKGISIPARRENATQVFHQYTIKVADGKRDALKKHLESAGIPTMIYYPGCLHLQKAYLPYGYKPGDFPVGELLSTQVLSLPMHTELKRETQAYIVDAIKAFLS